MALTIIKSNPASLSFAGNPIVFRVGTDKVLDETESFLRIVCSVECYPLDSNLQFDFKTELSSPVESGGEVVFNLSDTVQTLINRMHTGIDISDSPSSLSFGVNVHASFYTVWVADNDEVSTSVERAPSFRVIPGGLTDYEMLVKDDIYLPSLASGGVAMTRKPDGGIIYSGEELIVPWVKYNSEPSSAAISSDKLLIGEVDVYSGTNVGYSNCVEHSVTSPVRAVSDGPFTFMSNFTRTLSGYYRTNTHGVHFLRFINGFGAVENISVRSKDKLSYEVSGETHSLVQGATTRPTDRRYATKSQPVGVYELSSGYVPKLWAEWFVQELLTSPRVWIQLGGKWVPALIEAEDDCVIYDRTKPEMPHVDFTLRLAIDGVTGVTW